MDRTPSDRQGPDAVRAGKNDLERMAAPSVSVTRAARRPWTTPQLTTHESLTVMTQHFFGPAGVAFALQINCGVSGKKFGC
jgi:hypothetical protein